ncbi:D-alanyl-D-alanine carboxypeptidase [Melghirimyces profundicolus]|uniref:serine-type D-Ala-D-Ala carboxypeptidase n=1 Tax=Melghirimyces profundicolus TaxID=1242148 RepID=A0A2T6B458_9BACL|nr:D-alanyl-D-alanine carboxypeptidase family protein [Melghirimyces profundicolus]PTX50856.1 D-alanyl-D-alanine carboxypeptidase [Melghirimyces profundicolus]
MRLTRILIALCVFWVWIFTLSETRAGHRPTYLDLSAKSAAAIDVRSGRILYEKEARKRMRIASITKIMTAIVAIENGDLDEKVKVGPRAEGVEGSSIYLKQGEEIPLEHLLYGLMLRSGNDAAVAIAEHIGGSVEGFVYKMNEKAQYLGMEHSHFENPHGLDSPGHYSTAIDMARLAAYALKNPEFRKIVGTQVKTVPWTGEKWHRKWYNKNKLLRLYPGADGVKTGYTKLSKRTLVSSATRDGRQVAAVTLNAPDDWNDSMQLLEYGFRHFEETELVREGDEMASIPGSHEPRLAVTVSRSFRYPLMEEEKDRVKVKPMITYPLSKAKKEGIQVGTARILINGEAVGAVPLEVRVSEEETMMEEWLGVLAALFGRGG